MRSNPWFRVAVTACSVLVVLLLAASWRFLASHGVFTGVKPVSPGACRAITGLDGPGDIAVDAGTKTVIIAAAAPAPSAQDGLYIFAYEKPDARPARLAGQPEDFHPVAVSFVRNSGGAALLAVNRRSNGDYAVDVFEVSTEKDTVKLSEVGAITGDVLTDPADLAAIDRTRFYIVNRHSTRTAFGRWLDDTFGLPRAEVLYFDGMKFVPVVKRLVEPSGIAISADGSHVYVSENGGRTVLAFERNPYSGQLENAGSLAINSGLEKMSVGPDGGLWIAAQPKAFAVSAFRRDPADPAPSQVFRVSIEAGKPQSAMLIYSNEGSQIGAADTVAVADNRLLIGSALDRKLLDCALQ